MRRDKRFVVQEQHVTVCMPKLIFTLKTEECGWLRGLKRREAITLLTEIRTACQELTPDIVSLVHSGQNNKTSVGYQVHIQVAIDKNTEKQIHRITNARSLVLRKEKGRIIIYKPRKVLVNGKPVGA